MRRKGWFLIPVLWVTGMVFFFEGFCLVGAGPRRVIENSVCRVILGLSHPVAGRLIGFVFLTAGVAVLVAAIGLYADAPWWKALALSTWAVASLVIVVMLTWGLWSLGRPTVEPSFVDCALPLELARQGDYFSHIFLLAWLGISGWWIARSPRPAG